MSKNKQDLGPYRRKQFQTYFQFSLIAICFVIIFVLFTPALAEARTI